MMNIQNLYVYCLEMVKDSEVFVKSYKRERHWELVNGNVDKAKHFDKLVSKYEGKAEEFKSLSEQIRKNVPDVVNKFIAENNINAYMALEPNDSNIDTYINGCIQANKEFIDYIDNH